MPIWLADFHLPASIPIELHELGTRVGAGHARNDARPSLRLDNVVKPQTFSLIIPIWLANPLLVDAQASLVHEIVQPVIGTAAAAKVRPNVLCPPVIDGI